MVEGQKASAGLGFNKMPVGAQKNAFTMGAATGFGAGAIGKMGGIGAG